MLLIAYDKSDGMNMDPKISQSLMAGQWWRFSRYETRTVHGRDRGSYIVPAAGAKLSQYDPWRLWSQARNSRGREQVAPPYQTLLDLTARLRIGRSRTQKLSQIHSRQWEHLGWENLAEQLTPESRAEIAAWCAKFGLLGLLPHRLSQISLEGPRFRQEEVFFQTQYVRTASGWRESQFPAKSGEAGPAGAQFYDGEILRRESLQSIAKFFPSVPAPDLSDEWRTHRYPRPLTEEFWTEYAEPVALFLSAAHRLRKLIDGVSIKKKPRLRSSEERRLIEAIIHVDGLMAPVGFRCKFEQGIGLRPQITAGSLLSCFAAMILQDAVGGESKRCPVCGEPFMAFAYQQTYCTPTCRRTAQQRAYRENLRKNTLREKRGK